MMHALVNRGRGKEIKTKHEIFLFCWYIFFPVSHGEDDSLFCALFAGSNSNSRNQIEIENVFVWKVKWWEWNTIGLRSFSPLPRLSSSLIPFAFLIRQQCGLRLPIVIRGWRDGTSYVLPQVTNWSRRTLSITASDESLSYSKAFIIFFVFCRWDKI